MSDYSEDRLVEQPTIALFAALGWQTIDCFHEVLGANGTLGREATSDVVLARNLRAALERLNPDASHSTLASAIAEITRDRSALSLAQANREVYLLLKDGVKVIIRGDDGEESTEIVRVIDWENPRGNDYVLASQLWITGEVYKRRADLIGFVNGIPLVFVELKAVHRRLENAYKKNLRDYKTTIPQLFWYNALIVLSNGSQSRVGSATADWDHFAEWKKIDREGEEGIISLDTMIRGTCAPSHLLDLVENFTLFSEATGGLVKILAKNHQFLGVNAAIEAVRQIERNQGRLGVFWHTQGSGKSFSMVFFSQKILRKLPGNWTFLVVTDRDELDKQIYRTFATCGAVVELERQIHAASGEHLKQLLQESHRYVFTLIQKFRTERGDVYPALSRRSDLIVITDEAHRSQYDLFALNMRNALPRAAFIGFTGTPLMAGEEKTRQVFGEYVSIYNFKESVDDRATVPLFYENRIPELQLVNDSLNDDMERLLDEATLDDAQEAKLEREFAREYHLITRDDRLEKVAEDLVRHFMGRGFRGKAMVVSIDKMTAVRMYDKVRRYWREYLSGLRERLAKASIAERDELREQIRYMEETDLAVVVSQAQNEVEDFRQKGLDILPHRRRMLNEDLESKFKDPDDPFRIVFVCAMWMTGFDVPSCSTIYLDKPMRNHTLMQTIARANRVFKEKVNGLIVDYVGVFRDLKRALAIYGTAPGGSSSQDELPVASKQTLVNALRQAIADAAGFCRERGVDLASLRTADGYQRIRLLDDAVEAILIDEESKRRYLGLADDVDRFFRAILPDQLANEFSPSRAAIVAIADRIRRDAPEVDISGVMEEVQGLLDESIATEGYVIREGSSGRGHVVDLSAIDFEALARHFQTGHRRTEAEKLRAVVSRRLTRLVQLNRTRANYLERFQKLIDEYNAGSHNVETFFSELVDFAKALAVEEQRAIAESLSEEELAVFDLLAQPRLELTRSEERQVKSAARDLLDTLKREKLVLDWRKRQQTRAAVRVAIEKLLDNRLPRAYTPDLYHHTCDLVYQHVYDSYFGSGRGIYARAS